MSGFLVKVRRMVQMRKLPILPRAIIQKILPSLRCVVLMLHFILCSEVHSLLKLIGEKTAGYKTARDKGNLLIEKGIHWL